MSIPNNDSFNLQDVVTELGGGETSLQECFDNAHAEGFDATYNQDSYAPANSLLRFRNYQQGPVIIDIDNMVQVDSIKIYLNDGSFESIRCRGVSISNDGSKIFSSESGIIYRMNTTIPFANDYATNEPTISSGTNSFVGFRISPDGTSLYDWTVSNIIRRFSMSIPFDLSTLSSKIGDTIPPGISDALFIRDVCFSPDGTRMLIATEGADVSITGVYCYSLSVAYDITTLSQLNFFNVTTGMGASAIAWANDGISIMYITNQSTFVQQDFTTAYSLATTTGTPLTKASSVGYGVGMMLHGSRLYVNAYDYGIKVYQL